jgi:hypothetical protein
MITALNEFALVSVIVALMVLHTWRYR